MPRWSPYDAAVGRAGVGDDRQLEVFAQRPHGVVAAVVIRRLVDPHRRDHHRAEAVVLDPLDLSQHVVDRRGDRHQRDTLAPLGTVRAQVGQPAVVGLRTGQPEPRVHVAGEPEARHRTARTCGSRPRRRRGTRPRRRRRRRRARGRAGRPSHPLRNASSCSSNHFLA